MTARLGIFTVHESKKNQVGLEMEENYCIFTVHNNNKETIGQFDVFIGCYFIHCFAWNSTNFTLDVAFS